MQVAVAPALRNSATAGFPRVAQPTSRGTDASGLQPCEMMVFSGERGEFFLWRATRSCQTSSHLPYLPCMSPDPTKLESEGQGFFFYSFQSRTQQSTQVTVKQLGYFKSESERQFRTLPSRTVGTPSVSSRER
jgi:hypothetical protein